MVPGRRLLVACALGLLLAACEPEATPLPVNLPTQPAATSTAPAPGEQRLRYALAPGVENFLSAEDERLIGETATLVRLEAMPSGDAFGTQFDMLVALEAFPDSVQAAEPLQVRLVVNTTLLPLDDTEIEPIIREWLTSAETEPSARAAVRTRLANAGYPDGFDLTLAADIAFGAERVSELLNEIHVDVRPVTAGEAAHLTITTAPLGAPAVGYSTTLLAVPVYYHAPAGMNIHFTPAGFPIAVVSP